MTLPWSVDNREQSATTLFFLCEATLKGQAVDFGKANVSSTSRNC